MPRPRNLCTRALCVPEHFPESVSDILQLREGTGVLRYLHELQESLPEVPHGAGAEMRAQDAVNAIATGLVIGSGSGSPLDLSDGSSGHHAQRAVVVAVGTVRVVQVAAHQVVHVVAVRHRLVAALRPVLVVLRMVGAGMLRRALHGVRRGLLKVALVVLLAVLAVQVALVQVVHMVTMLHGGVAAAVGVLVIVRGVSVSALAHGFSSLQVA